MAVRNAMYLFEVVVESVKSYVESRLLVIRSDFADIFSLELKDPKQMHIVIPEPPPLPPEPVGKKGKKKKPKPKKKGKKGKKGKIELPPPEPVIQSGQSVLFTSSAEILIQNMNKFPMQVSLWSKEENLVFIGSAAVPWDPVFLIYLQKIANCEEPPSVTVRDSYNIFQEGTAKLMATLGLQVKLSYLAQQVTTSFRTLSEDPTMRKFLYTGMNSKTTSYMCTMKTTDEDFEENSNKIENNYVTDRPKPKPIVYADYKNAPGANVTFFNDGDYCCMGHVDKPPESIYKAPETCPDIDFIADYVRKIITSCNDNMRMLTPRPTITPRFKATDIDRLCYCKEKNWPEGALAERFKKEIQREPCPICIKAGGVKGLGRSKSATFDIANIRGPCGRPDCRIARDMRAYIENLVLEDNEEVNIEEIFGPCGSKSCTLAEKIQEFLRHEGPFAHGATQEGLSTQCACLKQMQDALIKRDVCDSECSNDCEASSSGATPCGGKGCPYTKHPDQQQVYHVYYFTVEHDLDNEKEAAKSSTSVSPSKTPPKASSASAITGYSSKYKYCSSDCPSKIEDEPVECSKSACYTGINIKPKETEEKCIADCPGQVKAIVSPADSEIIINFNDIRNPCCVKSCDIAETVKDFIVEGINKKQKPKSALATDDPCYCDCECSFKFSSKTTYCAVCGGYECLGDDMASLPEYAKPHPCPVYHKLYDKKYIKVQSPWPEEEDKKAALETQSTKSGKTQSSKQATAAKTKDVTVTQSAKNLREKRQKNSSEEKVKKKKKKKKVGMLTAGVAEEGTPPPQPAKKVEKYPHGAPVPRNMGWLWTAEDIPGLKPRPKWKPGAANKILVRRYRTVREGVDNIAKKKRALLQRKKKIEMKPTLVVRKQDGEYTVQMEVFKKYSKDRLLFQYPYDEKPPLMYTIGKTPEERLKIQKQRERRERRETRRKSRLLQSTFRDRCQEICLKAYNQAIGILPIPNINNPECPCDTEMTKPVSPPVDSCSCSEESTISSSDTDGDDWIIEFTPPIARWDAKAKHPPVLVENECQYNYLDYKIKLLDKQGNPVPRYFKGPDGKQECSDLGGFWGADHTWLDINKDGFIGPDNRWVPLNFIGPDGTFYSSEEGVYTDPNGNVWKIGVDGYIDRDGKWAWYGKRKDAKATKSISTVTNTADTRKSAKTPKSEGPAKPPPSPVAPTKGKPIVKGKDVKDTKAAVNTPAGNNKGKTMEKEAPPSTTPKGKKTVSLAPDKGRSKAHTVMNFSVNYDKKKTGGKPDYLRNVDQKKLAKYCEIIQSLQMYDDLGDLKPPIKTNRASNTSRRKTSLFSKDRCCRNMMALPVLATSQLSSSTACRTAC